jgi:hypothetical protein
MPPDFTPTTSFEGAAYVFAEPDGAVYVVDPPNGAIHKYLDVTETPEPSTLPLLILGAGPLGAFIYRRRKRTQDSR